LRGVSITACRAPGNQVERSHLRGPWTARAPHTCTKRKLAGWLFDVLPRLKPKDFNPPTYLYGGRAELRFTVRRPASAEVSPCCHRPSGGDVACSVHVGVARPRVTDLALENRLALAVLGCDMTARGASLRRVRGRDLLDPSVSLMLQTRGKQTPTACVDSPIQSTFLGNAHTRLRHSSPRGACHHAHVEGLDPDRIETPRDVSSGFFYPVLTTVGLTRFQLRNRRLRASSPAGAAPGAGKPLLQHLQPLSLTAAQARNAQQLTRRQGRRHYNTTVDTHNAALTRTSDGTRDMREPDMPAAGPIAGNPVGLHALGDRPRQAKTHPTHLGHPHPTEPAVQTLDVMRFHCDLAKSLMHTGFAPRRPAVRSNEKVAHGLRKVPQCLLLHGLRARRQPSVLAAGSGQLSTLLDVARRTTSRLPMLLLLDGQVSHISGVTTMLRQHRRLRGSRKQPISRHPRNVTATTDNLTKGDAAVFPLAQAWGSHAASNR
jgi:hypothetical protein